MTKLRTYSDQGSLKEVRSEIPHPDDPDELREVARVRRGERGVNGRRGESTGKSLSARWGGYSDWGFSPN